MAILRRFCAVGLSGLIVGALLSSVAVSAGPTLPAAADTTEAFVGTASAQALKLSLFGTTLTIGSTNVLADSTPAAHADGAGVGLIAATVSSADARGADQSSSPPKACALNLVLPNISALAAACSLSASSTTNGAPAAVSASNIAALDVGALNLVLQLLKPITDALTPVLNQLIGTVTTTVQSVLAPLNLGTTLDQLLGGLGLNLQSPVSSLLDALNRATQLVTIHVGDSASAVTTTGGTVIADSVAKGAQIDVLPGIALTGGPLISIVVGSAHTTSTYNRATGKSAATFDPTVLTVKLLGVTVPVALGAPITLFQGTVLETTISLGAGATTTNPDGSVGAVASGVGLDLLKGINGGISLHLAHAESAVGGDQARITPTTTSTKTTLPPVTGTVAVKTLATTGTSAPVLPIGMALILLGFLTRRTLRTRRAERTPRTPR